MPGTSFQDTGKGSLGPPPLCDGPLLSLAGHERPKTLGAKQSLELSVHSAMDWTVVHPDTLQQIYPVEALPLSYCTDDVAQYALHGPTGRYALPPECTKLLLLCTGGSLLSTAWWCCIEHAPGAVAFCSSLAWVLVRTGRVPAISDMSWTVRLLCTEPLNSRLGGSACLCLSSFAQPLLAPDGAGLQSLAGHCVGSCTTLFASQPAC